MVKLRSWKLGKLRLKWLGLVVAALACVGLGIALRLAYEMYWPRVTVDVPVPGVQPVTAVIPDSTSEVTAEEPPPVFSWPVDGQVVGAFGWYRDPLRQEWRYRDGVMLEAPAMSEVTAAADGEVVTVMAQDDGYEVHIKHSYDFETYYGPLETTSAALGQRVAAGDCIGLMPDVVGSSVMSFRLTLRGEPEDPAGRI